MSTDLSKYLGNDYIATDISYPYVQAVRGETDPKHCGYFIPASQLELAGWRGTPTTIAYTYNSGESETGLLLTAPRMVIATASPLGTFNRQETLKEKSLVIVGEWDKSHKQNPNYGNFQIYLILFLNEQNRPLHEIPFRLTAKGAHQGTLSQQWQKSCRDVMRHLAAATGKTYRPPNEKLMSLFVFQPIFQRRPVGKIQKSPACCVDDYVKPTPANWMEFFLGVQDDLAELAIAMLSPQPLKNLCLPTTVDEVVDLEPPELAPAIPEIVNNHRVFDEEIDADERIPF
jgi:hypothetical protein